jgi:hypothetical protein
MQNIITPSEFQELIKNKKISDYLSKTEHSPAKITLSLIMGYSAALNVIKTKNAGKISLLLN